MKPQPSMAPPSASYLDQRRRQTGFVPRLELEPPDVAPSPPQPKARSAASPLITLCTILNHESKRLKVMQRGLDPSDAQSRGMAHMDLGLPDVYSYMYSFPYDDEFLAPGKEVMCCRDWVACTRDACYGFCVPRSCLFCQSNYGCTFLLAFCFTCGNDVGHRFIWPSWCPCGCLTCCCPCTGLGEDKRGGVCDVACVCCKSPAKRTDSMRYWIQRMIVAGTEEVLRLWPLPTDPKQNPPYDSPGPNDFASSVEALADFMTSVPCLFTCCVLYQRGCCGLCGGRPGFAPNTTYMPASGYVGQHDDQMNTKEDCGGYWAFPASFETYEGKKMRGVLPTPPRARDRAGRPLQTNVKPGAPGSKVIYWSHGSGYIATQSADYLWMLALFLSQQTGHVVLVGEYPLASKDPCRKDNQPCVYPTQVLGWTRTYMMLVKLYGSENIVVAGDSAGGGLTLTMLLSAAENLYEGEHMPSPAGMLLISPFIDLRDCSADQETVPSMAANSPKENGGLAHYGCGDMLPRNGYKQVCAVYASSAARATISLISPILATQEELAVLAEAERDRALLGGSKKLPMETLMLWGDQEILLTQDEQMFHKLSSAMPGLVAKHVVRDGFHVSPVLGLATIENVGCCAGNNPGHSEVARAWYTILLWLRDTVKWEETQVPPEWAPAVL